MKVKSSTEKGHGQLIFDQGTKKTQWGKDSLFNKCCWKRQIYRPKRMKLSPYLTPHTRINSKWIKGLNVRPEMIRLLEENIWEELLGLGLGDYLFTFDLIPKAQATKAKIHKWDYTNEKVSA